MLCRVIGGGSRVAAAVSSEVRTVLGFVYVAMVTAASRSRRPRPVRLSVRRAGHAACVRNADPSSAVQRSCGHGGRRRDPYADIDSVADVRQRGADPGRRRRAVPVIAVRRSRLAARQNARLGRDITETLPGDTQDSVTGRIDTASVTRTQTPTVFYTLDEVTSQ